MPALLVRVHLDEVAERDVDGAGFEEGGLRARLGGPRRRVRRYGAAAQPGQRGGGRPGLAEAPLVAQEEGLGGLDVIAPVDPHPVASRRGWTSAVDRHTTG